MLLMLIVAVHAFSFQDKPSYLLLPPIPNDERAPLQLSSDLYANKTSQHQTEVEPDTFSYGSTIVTAFQVGRFSDGAVPILAGQLLQTRETPGRVVSCPAPRNL